MWRWLWHWLTHMPIYLHIHLPLHLPIHIFTHTTLHFATCQVLHLWLFQMAAIAVVCRCGSIVCVCRQSMIPLPATSSAPCFYWSGFFFFAAHVWADGSKGTGCCQVVALSLLRRRHFLPGYLTPSMLHVPLQVNCHACQMDVFIVMYSSMSMCITPIA